MTRCALSDGVGDALPRQDPRHDDALAFVVEDIDRSRVDAARLPACDLKKVVVSQPKGVLSILDSYSYDPPNRSWTSTALRQHNLGRLGLLGRCWRYR